MLTSIAQRLSLSALRGRLGGFGGDRRGVAALEFALVAPLLLSLYLVTLEVSQGIEANKKVGRVASMVADLVTQQSTSVPVAELNSIMQIGASILQPYDRTNPTIVITGIEITDEDTPRAIVRWSRKLVNGATSRDQADGTIVTIPSQLMIRNTFLVRVTSDLDYRPMITWTADQKAKIGLLGAFDNIQMSERYYLRPRMSARINCTGC
jgi:Flp pilus assembly protein TadG